MDHARTAIALLALTAGFMAIGAMLGDTEGMIIALGVVAAFNGWSWWRGAKTMLRIFDAQPMDQGSRRAKALNSIVADLAGRAGIPLPRLYLIDEDQPNAFAVGRSPSNAGIVVSTGLLRTLASNEVSAVLAHEIGHIVHRDTLAMTLTATIAGAITYIGGALALLGFVTRKEGGGGMIVFGLVAGLGAILLQLALGRGLEYAADRYGAELCASPQWLISALRRLAKAEPIFLPPAEEHPATAALFFISPLHGGRLQRLFDTHPPIEARIRRLEAMAKDARAVVA